MATATAPIPLEGARRPKPASRRSAGAVAASSDILVPWLRAQSINVTRHAAALRPFRREEFGTGAAAPSEGHVQAANQLISSLRKQLLRVSGTVHKSIAAAQQEPGRASLQRAVLRKDRAHKWVQGIEKIWDFYLELFGQRQSMPYGDWLLSCDRIALDCYQ